MEADMLSDRQMHLIKQAKALGFGYSIFASNIERQGFCSQKQEAALDNMVSAGEYRKNNWKSSCSGRKLLGYKHDISDCEAMQSGDYF
jgi:hypothetical protein